MKKKFNLEKILETFKKEPKIAKKYGLEPEIMTIEDLENLEVGLMMDILMEYSSPIRKLN